MNEGTAARLQMAARERGTDAGRLLDQTVRDALERLPVADAPNDTPEAAQPFKRIAGLTPGAFFNSDDFDAELPGAFWLGEEERGYLRQASRSIRERMRTDLASKALGVIYAEGTT